MGHRVTYIIESDRNIRFDYVEVGYQPYFHPTWQVDINEFSDISMVDPNSPYSPELVRVPSGTNYKYYYKTMFIPWSTTNFKICVEIDGVEGNNSFVFEENVSFIKTKRRDSEIYVTVSCNKRREERSGSIVINYSSKKEIATTLRFVQEACDVDLKLEECTIDDGLTTTTVQIDSTSYEYEFDTLTDKTDEMKQQSLTFKLGINGVKKQYYVKSVKEYVSVGEIDSSYVLRDGKYYRRKEKYVDGQFLTYYSETFVKNNIGYELMTYDNGLKMEKLANNQFRIISYGRVFMETDAFYIITLANSEDISITCEIKITYADVPTNLAIS